MKKFPVAFTLKTLPAVLFASAAFAADAGDAVRGKTLFQQSCALCHPTTPGSGGQGPNVVGVFGRKAASAVPAFNFTPALTNSGLTWDAATLDRFLANPQGVVPGTAMPIPLPKAEDRADIIAFLKTLTAPAAGNANAANSGRQMRGKPSLEPDNDDWHLDKPGRKFHIKADALPPLFATSSAGNNPKVVDAPADAKLSVPEGFQIKKFAGGLNNPRIVHVAPNGDIFVAETRANRIRVMRAADGAEAPSENDIFVTDVDRPFGIAFYPLGDNPQWIYIAENNAIVRFPYKNGDLKASGGKQVIVPKLSNTNNGHSTRDVVFTKDGKRMLISVGSASNVAEEMKKKTLEEAKAWDKEHGKGAAWDTEENRADVLVTDPEGKAPLRVFASGIRNGVGLAINPTTGDLWTATNERDGLGDNLVPDYITRVKEGGYYGWPWYFLGNHEDPRLKGDRPDLAGQAIVPDVLLQAHSAALGIAFYPTNAKGVAAFPSEFRGDLFGALHGSWNRNSRTGYKIVRVRLKNGVPSGEYEDFLTGFVVDGTSVWGRPVGVAIARDGALLVTEDGNNTMWRISPIAK